MVYVEAQEGGSVHAHGEAEQDHGQLRLVGAHIAQAHQRDHGYPQANRVEELPAGHRGNAVPVVQLRGDEREDELHAEHADVGQRGEQGIRLDVLAQDVLHVAGNLGEQRPEAPVVHGVGHDQDQEAGRCEEAQPGRGQLLLGHLVGIAHLAGMAHLDQLLLLQRDALALRRRTSAEEEVHHRPHDT